MKGPWFRMSSISYPEIFDTQKAVKELAGNFLPVRFIFIFPCKYNWFSPTGKSCYHHLFNLYLWDDCIAEKDYICSLEDGNQLCESDMNDILDVLSLSELREIWSFLLKKVGINH